MPKRILLIILIIFALTSINYAQLKIVINGDKYYANPAIGLVGGVTGFQSTEIEAGIGFNYFETRPRNKTFTKPFIGCSLSALYNPNDPDLIGENFTVWANMLFDFGVAQTYYEKGEMNTWGMKPFIGLGIYGFSLTYGYNIFLTKNEIEELSEHIFAIRYFLPIIGRKKKKID